MVNFCCILSCAQKNSDPGFSFHQIPTGKTELQRCRREQWIKAIGRQDINYAHAKICSRHFVTGKPAKFNENHKVNWVPTLFLDVNLQLQEPSSQFLVDVNNNDNESEGVDKTETTHSTTAEVDISDLYTDVSTLELFYTGTDQGADVPFDNDDVLEETPYVTEDEILEEWLEDEAEDEVEDDGEDEGLENTTGVDLENTSVDAFQDDGMIEEWLDENENVEVACFQEPHEEPQAFERQELEDHIMVDVELRRTHQSSGYERLDTTRDSDAGMNTLGETDTIEKYEQLLMDKESEIRFLKSRLNVHERPFDFKYFEGDDNKTRHFTGLPNFTTLKIVYEYVQGGILILSPVLTKEQVFIMVLMRLRLNLKFKTLGYLFEIATSTVTKYFYSGLYSMYQQLKSLIKWPEDELLKNHMPSKFKKAFPDGITSIIDCFEIFAEKPGTKDATIKMFSNYKHHYTTKFLISITPFGSISFVSKPYSGRSSDKTITEACGFMEMVKENDIILADRGFTIQRAIQEKGASLKVPDSSTKKRQLSSIAVERTRALASVRNEVERCIGALRGKYTILKGPVCITLMNHKHNGIDALHMAVTVSCALVNLCPSIIK